MIVVSVCLPSDALPQRLLSYLGFSYLGHGVSLHGCSSKEQLLYIYVYMYLHLIKAMVFTVVMYGCESWSVKKAVC